MSYGDVPLGAHRLGPSMLCQQYVSVMLITFEKNPHPVSRMRVRPFSKQLFTVGREGWFNAMFMIGLIGSASTGLGLTTPLITESFKTFFGLEPSFGFHNRIHSSDYHPDCPCQYPSRLDRGIKRLSNCNLGTHVRHSWSGLFFRGPTLAITKQGFESITFMIRQFPAMSGILLPW